MDSALRETAQACITGAHNGTMSFPQIVATLIGAGFDGYLVDFRLAQATYYLPSGACVSLPTHTSSVAVEAAFDASAVQAAIHEAQAEGPGYTYGGFCDRAKRAGCAGYLVSFSGRRVLYFGRSGGTHTEPFPQ